MTTSTRTIGIGVASLIAVLLIGTAVVLSGPLPFHVNRVDAESTHDILVSYAAKDTDNDGLPDWEESLYGTDPANPHSVNASLTDSEAVAQGAIAPKLSIATTTPTDVSKMPGIPVKSDTVTDQFARTFFSNYLLNHGPTPPSQQEIASFVEKGVAELEAKQQIQTAFNAGQVRVTGSGSDALTSYAAQAQAAFAKHTVATTKAELDYYSDGVTKNDAAGIKKVNEIAKGYSSTAYDLIKVSPPREAANAHLQLANALAEMGEVLTDMGAINTDPLRAMVGIRQYDAAHQHLITAFSNMYAAYTGAGVVMQEGTNGYYFYHAASVGAQAASQTTSQ